MNTGCPCCFGCLNSSVGDALMEDDFHSCDKRVCLSISKEEIQSISVVCQKTVHIGRSDRFKCFSKLSGTRCVELSKYDELEIQRYTMPEKDEPDRPGIFRQPKRFVLKSWAGFAKRLVLAEKCSK